MKSSNELEKLVSLIQKGNEYENLHHNLRMACEYYGEARNCLKSLYGENSKLCNIVNLWDYIYEKHQMNYRAAVLKLADAGEFLDQFRKQDIKDEFTEWIYKNRELLLNEAVNKTLNTFQYLDFQYSLEDMAIQLMFIGNDMEEVLNRTLIDPLGFPRKFHYVLRQICENAKNISPDIKHKAAELYSFMHTQQGSDFSNMEKSERTHLAKSLYSLLQEGIYHPLKNTELNDGISSFIDSSRNRVNFDMIRGMLGLDETEFADSLLSKLKKDYNFNDIDSQIKLKLLECLLEDRKENKSKAKKILDEIITILDNVIMQVFFMKDEQKKLEFLNGIEYLLKRIAAVCSQIKSAKDTYSLVARTRMLSFDHVNINLSNDEHMHIVKKKQQLELREKAGEDVSAEHDKLIAYFKKISYGIFDFNPMEICEKLTDKQAVLEFTIMIDERDVDFYYVFIVTAKKISIINLGNCKKINKYLDAIMKYIANYASCKYSDQQIKMLPQYYDLYKMVLSPIGEMLPQNIHNLFIAGAGNFLKIPFGLLPCFNWYDKFLEEEYHICYINSGKEILRNPNHTIDQGAMVIGNPDFDGTFPPLPSSGQEAKAVAKLLKTAPITGKAALPECLKTPAGIYHISTHSHSVKAQCSKENANPMEESGLVFAGGKFLLAKEISRLNMDRTNLVVLSICGVNEGKGVYSDLGPGIRRAFVNAGVRHIILNLWETDDNAAQLLMKCFYNYYIQENKTIEESLRDAKRYLRTSPVYKIKSEQYYDESMEAVLALMDESEIPYSHPYYWAGFISFGL